MRIPHGSNIPQRPATPRSGAAVSIGRTYSGPPNCMHESRPLPYRGARMSSYCAPCFPMQNTERESTNARGHQARGCCPVHHELIQARHRPSRTEQSESPGIQTPMWGTGTMHGELRTAAAA
eukprot:4662577-Prymnesium_polylepis.1